MKRILVTGGEGYIGSHVCKVLAEHGHDVCVVDTRFHGEYNDVSKYVNKEFSVFNIFNDITDRIPFDSWDAVVHLAGRSVVPQSLKEPYEYYRVNTMGTYNLLRQVQTDNFIFASTSSAFEMASPYARSKVAAEDIIREKASGYTIFRFFNVSGTDGTNRQLGPASHLIRRCAMVAAGILPKIEIYGDDYDTRDGTCIRDYIHVIDVSNAILSAIDRGPANSQFECLGSREGYSVIDVLNAMERVNGKPIPFSVSPRRAGDAVSCVVDQLSDYCNLTKSLEDMCSDQLMLELRNK